MSEPTKRNLNMLGETVSMLGEMERAIKSLPTVDTKGRAELVRSLRISQISAQRLLLSHAMELGFVPMPNLDTDFADDDDY